MKITHLFLDVDGVMTDGKNSYTTYASLDNRSKSKQFNDKDFTAIDRFKAAGVRVVLLTGDGWNENMAASRGIDCLTTEVYLKVSSFDPDDCEKLNIIKEIVGDDLSRVCYVGDDYFDVPVLKAVGFPTCPSDAIDDVLKVTQNFRLKAKGGEGVIAELYSQLSSMR